MQKSTDDLFETLARNGIRLWLVDHQLHYCALKGIMTPDLRDALTIRRDAIISALLNPRATPAGALPPPSPQRDHPVIPLTFQQKRVWSLGEIFGVSFVNRYALELRGPLDRVSLARAFDSVTLRHDALRIAVTRTPGGPGQRTNHDVTIDLDPTGVSESAVTPKNMANATALVEAFLARPLDVEAGPPLRATLVQLSDSHHVLGISLHDLVADGISIGIFFRELWHFYAAFAYRDSVNLPHLPIQYADYAAWQRRVYPGWVSRHREYWNEKLDSATALQFEGAPRTEPQQPHAAQVVFRCRTTEGLRNLARHEKTTTAMVILAAFAISAARICGQSDFIVSFPITGRDQYGGDSLIGRFAYPLYLRLNVAFASSLVEALRMVTHEYFTSWEHRDNGAIVNERPELARTRFEYLPWSPFAAAVTPAHWRGNKHRLQAAELPFNFQPPKGIESPYTARFQIDVALRFYEEANEIRGDIATHAFVSPDIAPQLSRDIQHLCDATASVLASSASE